MMHARNSAEAAAAEESEMTRGVAVTIGSLALLAGAAWLLLLDSPRVVVQLRALAVFGGGAGVLAAVARPGQVGALLLAWALLTLAAPDGARVAAPWIAWGAALAAPLLAALSWRAPDRIGLALAPVAVLGWSTGVASGVDGALLVALGLLAWPLVQRFAAGPVLLLAAGATLSLRAAWTARWTPEPLVPALVAVGLLVAAARYAGDEGARRPLMVVALVVGVGLSLRWAPSPSLGDWAAERLAVRTLPPDDVGGWRRLWRLDHPPRSFEADAGP